MKQILLHESRNITTLMLKSRLYFIFLFLFHLQTCNAESLLCWNFVSSLHEWKLLKDPFSFVFISFSPWLSMGLDMRGDWLLLTMLSVKIGFRLLKGTMWTVAFPPWLGDLSDVSSCTCLLCSEAQHVTQCLFLFPLKERFGCRSDGREDISWHTKTC